MADRLIRPMLEGYPVGWFAPFNKVLEDAWRYFKLILEPVIVKKDETAHYIQLVTGGELECWSMDSGLVARSRKYKEVGIDEAAQIADLEMRWEAEIRPTLVDYQGGAWFGSTPNGLDDFYNFYLKAEKDPEWQSWQKPSWENPLLPVKERRNMRRRALVELDPVARQEYGAEFVSSGQAFVPPGWVDACAAWGDQWKPLDRLTPICVGLDAASKSDTFAISGQGRDPYTRKYKTAFVKVFQPADLVDGRGIVTFEKPKQFIRDVAQSYHVISFVYDPFQLISTAGELFGEGIGYFEEFPQTTKRALSDQLFYELIRDQNWQYSGVEHQELAQHIKNANAKIEANDRRRIVKRTDKLKVDSAVASAMGLLALQNYNV